VAYALDRAKPVIPVAPDDTVLDQLSHIQHVTVTSARQLPGALLTALYEYCGPSTVRVYTNEELGITAVAADELTERMREFGMTTMVRPHRLADLVPDALYIHAGTSPEVLRAVLRWVPYEVTYLYPPEYEGGTFRDLPGTVDDAWDRPAAISCGLCSALDRMRRDAPSPWETAAPVTANELSRIAAATHVTELNERLHTVFDR
jgi:hypothetical protein